MKVNIIKDHHFYPKGVTEVPEERAKYLLSIGVAVEISDQPKEKPEMIPAKEKVEIAPKKKEKAENKLGNVSQAKKLL